jgi:hypothetical protein
MKFEGLGRTLEDDLKFFADGQFFVENQLATRFGEVVDADSDIRAKAHRVAEGAKAKIAAGGLSAMTPFVECGFDRERGVLRHFISPFPYLMIACRENQSENLGDPHLRGRPKRRASKGGFQSKS